MRRRPLGMMAVVLAVSLLACGSGCAPGIFRPSSRVSGEYPAHVFCVRGLVNVFSFGMDTLCTRLNDLGIDARMVCYGCYGAMALYIQNRRANGDTKPIILVGHSHGADDALRAAYLLKLAGIRVALMVTIDPVDPPRVPSNVDRAYNIFYSQPLVSVVPFFRGTKIKRESGARTEVINMDIRRSRVMFDKRWVDHFNIEDQTGIQNLALEQIFQTIRQHTPTPPTSVTRAK